MTPAKHNEQGIRKTGIPALGDIPWGTHVCQFYHTKEDLIDILVPYFKAGLESHELCAWITSEPLCAQEAEEALATSVAGLEKHIRSGQIEIISAGEWYLKEGALEPPRLAYRHIAVLGLPVVYRRLTYPMLAAQLRQLYTCFCFSQNRYDLLLLESCATHRSSPFFRFLTCRHSNYNWHCFRGEGHPLMLLVEQSCQDC